MAGRLAGGHRHRRPARSRAAPPGAPLQGPRGRRAPRHARRCRSTRPGSPGSPAGGDRRLRRHRPGASAARASHGRARRAAAAQRQHPPQFGAAPRWGGRHHRGGLPLGLPRGRLAADVEDPWRGQAAAARPLRGRARPRGAAAVLGALLRRPRRPDRPGLLRAGGTAGRREPAAAAAAGRLLRPTARDGVGRAVRAHRSGGRDGVRAGPLARHRRAGAAPSGPAARPAGARPPGRPTGAQLLAECGRRLRRGPPALADPLVLRGGRAAAWAGRRGDPAAARDRERAPARICPLQRDHPRAERTAGAAVGAAAAAVRRPGAGGLVGGARDAAGDDRVRERPARRPAAGRPRRGPRRRRPPDAGLGRDTHELLHAVSRAG